MKKFLIALVVVIALFVIFMMMGPFYIIDEGSQAVVTRFGKIVDSHTEAGLYFKMPFIDQITVYPKRILSLDGEAYRIPTKENQFIILDATSRWKISDPEKFYQSLTTLDFLFVPNNLIPSSSCSIITLSIFSSLSRISSYSIIFDFNDYKFRNFTNSYVNRAFCFAVWNGILYYIL